MNRFVEMLKEKPMTLVLSMPRNDAALCRAAFEAGADVVKVHSNLSHHASGMQFLPFEQYEEIFREMLQNAPGPVGIVPGADAAEVRQTALKASALPFSFFSLYAHHVPPSIVSLPQALMAACASDYTGEEIAAFADAGASVLEASVIPGDGYGQPLSLRDVMRYRRICSATRLPVVVPTQRRILPEDLPFLLDTGVKGIMIGAIVTGRETEGILRAIELFRTAIDKL